MIAINTPIQSNNSIFAQSSMSKQNHIITVVGARPQFIKAAAISRCLAKHFPKIKESILHTGQHYDESMSQVFFDELGIPKPQFHLNAGTHESLSIGRMIDELVQVFTFEKPNGILVYGDTNSTFAAAVAANMLQIPLFHVEAGLRSFNKSMPEEMNRIYTDQVATLLFCPTQTAINNLDAEGFNIDAQAPFKQNNPCILFTGDIMLDNLNHFSTQTSGDLLRTLEIEKENYVLLTLHRPQNADNPERLSTIIQGLMKLCDETQKTLVFPIHPRTRATLENKLPELWSALQTSSSTRILEPLSYLPIIELIQNAAFVATDSGGLQKEAHFLNKAVVILRAETEWSEIVDDNNAILVDADPVKIANISFWLENEASRAFTPHFGNGQAATEICESIESFLDAQP